MARLQDDRILATLVAEDDAGQLKFFDEDNFCVTRINLLDASFADVDTLNFGLNGPPTVSASSVLKTIGIRLLSVPKTRFDYPD